MGDWFWGIWLVESLGQVIFLENSFFSQFQNHSTLSVEPNGQAYSISTLFHSWTQIFVKQVSLF